MPMPATRSARLTHTLRPLRDKVRMRTRRTVDRVLSQAVHRTWRTAQRVGSVTSELPGMLRFRALGEDTRFAFPIGTVFGEQWITVGSGCIIGELVSVSAGLAPGHDLGPDPVVQIGDGCTIGRGSHIVGHRSIVIGDDVWTGPYIYITDQNHSYADPSRPIGRQWPVNETVEIGAGSWLGAGVVVLPGAKLGRNTVVAAGSVVRGEFPDHCVLAGVPARVVRRYDAEEGWQPPLRKAPAPLPEDITHEELVALLDALAEAEKAAGDGGVGGLDGAGE